MTPLRPLGTLLTAAHQLDDAPWSAALLSSPRQLRTTKRLPLQTWFRTPHQPDWYYPAHGDPTRITLLRTRDFHPDVWDVPPDARPHTPPYAFAFTPDPGVPHARLLTCLRRLPRLVFLRLDNWTSGFPVRTGFLHPQASFTPLQLAEVLQAVPPLTPVIVTRPTLRETLQDLALVRLWDAYVDGTLPPSSLVAQQVAVTRTGRCPSCPAGPRLVSWACPQCGGSWRTVIDLLFDPSSGRDVWEEGSFPHGGGFRSSSKSP